jgi:hypothetical protein
MKVRFDQSTNCCGRDRKRSLPWQPALVRHARHLAGEWRFIGEDLPEQTGEGRVTYPGLEIIAKLATVLEVEPAELVRAPAVKGECEGCRGQSS